MQNRRIFISGPKLLDSIICWLLRWLCTWTIRYKVPCMIQPWFFRGRWELHWVLPSGVPKVYHGTQIEETRCGKKNNQHCSRLTLSPALAQHTGSYRCRYRQKQRKQASVYVYITGKTLQVNARTLSFQRCDKLVTSLKSCLHQVFNYHLIGIPSKQKRY